MDRFKAGLKNAAAAVPTNKDSALAAKDEFGRTLEQFDSLAKLEERTGRTRVELVGAAIAGFLGLMMLSIFVKPLGTLMTRLFGFMYPTYQSFKAIEHGTEAKAGEKADVTQWLTYWFVFAVLSLAEETVLRPLGDGYMAVYFFVKIVLLLWAFLPQTKGAEFIFTEFLQPQIHVLKEKLEKAKAE